MTEKPTRWAATGLVALSACLFGGLCGCGAEQAKTGTMVQEDPQKHAEELKSMENFYNQPATKK